VNGKKKVYISGLDPAILINLKEKHAEFPLVLIWSLTDKRKITCCAFKKQPVFLEA